MDKAQEKAWEVYPEPVQANYPDSFDGYEQFLQDSVTNALSRSCFTEGYRQSEKDLALTWEDIQRLAVIMDEEECDWNTKVWEKQEVAEQVLHRFNEERNKQL